MVGINSQWKHSIWVMCLFRNICRSPRLKWYLDIIVISINSISLSIQLEQVTIIQIKHLISSHLHAKKDFIFIVSVQTTFFNSRLLDFDLILAMDHQNFDDIHDLLQRAIFHWQPSNSSKVALMSEHDPQYPQQPA